MGNGRNHNQILPLEKSLGINVPLGISRQTSLVDNEDLRSLFRGLDDIKQQFRHHTRSESRGSEDLKTKGAALLAQFGAKIWSDEVVRSWLTSAETDTLGGLYTKDLYWSDLLDRAKLQDIFSKLVVEKVASYLANQRVRNPRSASRKNRFAIHSPPLPRAKKTRPPDRAATTLPTPVTSNRASPISEDIETANMQSTIHSSQVTSSEHESSAALAGDLLQQLTAYAAKKIPAPRMVSPRPIDPLSPSTRLSHRPGANNASTQTLKLIPPRGSGTTTTGAPGKKRSRVEEDAEPMASTDKRSRTGSGELPHPARPTPIRPTSLAPMRPPTDQTTASIARQAMEICDSRAPQDSSSASQGTTTEAGDTPKSDSVPKTAVFPAPVATASPSRTANTVITSQPGLPSVRVRFKQRDSDVGAALVRARGSGYEDVAAYFKRLDAKLPPKLRKQGITVEAVYVEGFADMDKIPIYRDSDDEEWTALQCNLSVMREDGKPVMAGVEFVAIVSDAPEQTKVECLDD
ncbi:hypothetical protein LTR56_016166 [Elasticomyces elasticus]|nr:hypothetical protein LTR56_016166 [Elasticomyces elasticus]KAK3642125.1 hypothetical protein LTR22_016246 [Elasticomyces elasticus]KAK4914173.1 hypothetical protein LTR49_017526 [Elasticomyces elasticus]KAK5762534.1 hypothetical protein LTS12_007325 [Elasticomyces elasticus]